MQFLKSVLRKKRKISSPRLRKQRPNSTNSTSLSKGSEVKPQRASQEFYCGECNGYFMVRLNMALNHEVHVKCPNCGHEHRRVVQDGIIYESGRYGSDVKERVLTTIATYHKEPITERMIKAHAKKQYAGRRDGVKMTSEQLERWAEIAQRESTGAMFDD